MRKNNPKYKAWLKKRLRHLEKKRIKKNKTSKSVSRQTSVSQNASSKAIRNRESFKVVAPQNFSIKDNPIEVANFFDAIVKFTKSRRENVNILFDMQNVESITADAILYLLAVIKDLQKLGIAQHRFIGNLPKNAVARDFFIQTGFLDYVNSKIAKDYSKSQCVQIMSNNVYDQLSTKKICDFVCEVANLKRVDTKFLYVLINEMMLNVHQHAYNDLSVGLNKWYLFVQNDDNIIKFTFLDIGHGIPNTVKKKWHEKIFSRESTIIASALNGEFRTETKQGYRGKGLPKIKECVFQNEIDNFVIVSNKGYCRLCQKDGSYLIEEEEMQNPILGTIYYWEIKIK